MASAHRTLASTDRLGVSRRLMVLLLLVALPLSSGFATSQVRGPVPLSSPEISHRSAPLRSAGSGAAPAGTAPSGITGPSVEGYDRPAAVTPTLRQMTTVPDARALDTPPPEQLAFVDPCATDAAVGDHRASLDALAPEWAAGDLMDRVELPDGSALWIFGDSFLGDVESGALAPGWRFVNSTALMQRGACFEVVDGFGGGSWIPSVEAGIVLWPQEALVLGDELFVFSIRIERDESKPPGLDFRQVGGLIAVYDLDDLSVPRTMVFDVPNIRGNPFGWGALVDDGFVYAYAHEEPTGTFVARFAVDAVDSPDQWVFWDGADWVADHGAAAAIIPTRARVAPVDGGFVAFALPVFERSLEVWRALSPQGPWTRDVVVDVEAAVDPDPTVPSWIYEPLVIGDVDARTTIAVNFMPDDPSLIPDNVALYGPRFFDVDVEVEVASN